MLKLNFNLRHQAITLLNPGTIVATDSKNYLVANFNFISDDWEYPLTAVFTSDVEKIPYTILVGQSEELEENECFIPWEVLQSSGNVYVSVFCGDLHTTNTVKFKVVKSGYTDGETPPPPTPTIYEQILQALDGKQPMLTAGQNITITEENVISASSGSNDYTDLTNKPSINNVTLSGNKSSDDLSLQGKLTAGENITIEDNVISATGGVTSYNDLTDKPTISGNDEDRDYHSTAIGNIVFSEDFYLQFLDSTTVWLNSVNGNKIYNLSLSSFQPYLSEGLFHEVPESKLTTYGKDLNFWGYLTSKDHIAGEGNICVRITNPSLFRNLPEYVYTNNLNCTVLSCSTNNSACGFQLVFTRDIININKIKIFARYRASSYPFTASWQPWQELTGGGAQIVSGVVNQNGTITFTDSEGNSFTTSGESVIGADGFSPSATVQQTASGATITVTDKSGTTTANITNGADGNDYVLTNADKQEIAQMAVNLLPNADSVSY